MQSTTPNHILSAEQFNQDYVLDHLIERAEHYSTVQFHPENRRQFMGEHAGRLLFNVFYEPSTRTSFSFRTAATNLGMDVIGTEAAGQFSSVAKGETLEDTTRMAALSDQTTIINAGDGRNEHPTQALLDVFTIQKEFGRRDDLKIVIGGDIAGGRTAKSLLNLLGIHRSNSFTLVAPEDNNAGEAMKKTLATLAAEVEYSYELSPEILKDADIVYWTRTQTERGSGEQDRRFILHRADLKLMNRQGIVMHPLPRISELSTDIDDDPRARYFQQAANGLPVRMALLDWVLKNDTKDYFIVSGLTQDDKITVPAHLTSVGRTDSEMHVEMHEIVTKEFERRIGRRAKPGELETFLHWKQGDKGPIE
jgi:aspartate carbamoyltransferase catalytic subunit